MDEARKKRAQALDEKKKRLEELRKKRAERAGGGDDAALDGSSHSATSTTPTRISPVSVVGASSSFSSVDDSVQLNDYINSLLGAPSPAAPTQSLKEREDEGEPAISTSSTFIAPRIRVSSPPPAARLPASSPKPRQRTIVKGLGKISINPAVTEVYPKGTQTDPIEDASSPFNTTISSPNDLWSGEGPISPRSSLRRTRGHSSTPSHHHVPGKHTMTLGGTQHLNEEGRVSSLRPQTDELGSIVSPKEEAPPKVLTAAEKEEVMGKVEFHEFLTRSSLLVERVLGQEETYDAFVDYGADREGSNRKRRGEHAEALTLLTQFYEDKHCQDRAIMDLHWSPHYAELVLAAYNTHSNPSTSSSSSTVTNPTDLSGISSGTSSGGDPDGLVLVWSLALPSRPEYHFTCQSPVLTAKFHDFDSCVVLGGCYSGQIVLWDTRAKSLPIQRTPLSATGHTHPVYSLGLTGTTNAHTLVTASSDGRVCYWDLSQMNQPMEVVELREDESRNPSILNPGDGGFGGGSIGSGKGSVSSTGNRGGGISITAFAFDHEKGADELVVGSESGHLYVAPSMHRRQGGAEAKGSLATTTIMNSTMSSTTMLPGGGGSPTIRQLEAHFGLVTSLSRHPSTTNKNLSPLLLSASVDWSMRLWNLKKTTDPLAIFNHGTYDYVADVKWCPAHPAVFSSITSGGDLYLWNLNSSLEVPITKAYSVADATTNTTTSSSTTADPSTAAAAAGVIPTAGSSSSSSNRSKRCALTRVAWSTEGRKLAVGDARGYVHILGVAEEVTKARMDEEIRLEETLQHRSTVTSSSIGEVTTTIGHAVSNVALHHLKQRRFFNLPCGRGYSRARFNRTKK